MDARKTTFSHGNCPAAARASMACTSEILSNKWMPQLLFVLSYGVKRFGELQKEAGNINPRTLSHRLDELEKAGIVHKTMFAEVPPRVEYILTQKGIDLVPVLEQMVAWGNKYNQPSES